MREISFPLRFVFKIFTPSNDFSVLDAQGFEIAYTRQKIFKIKESVEIFRNANRDELCYSIKADRIIDFNAVYHVRDADGALLGSIRRAGVRSLWRTHYEISHANGTHFYNITEVNPWVALIDGLVGEVPILGWFTGYFLNPSYKITRVNQPERAIFMLKKEASFMERKFSLHKIEKSQHDELITLSCMMLMLLERANG